MEDSNSGPCPTGGTRNGNRHRVLPPLGGIGVDPGGLPKNSKKVKRGRMQSFTIERGNPLLTDLWVKPQTKGFNEVFYFVTDRSFTADGGLL